MAVDDLWYRKDLGLDGKPLPSKQHGIGKRWRVRYYPDGPGTPAKTRRFKNKKAAESFDNRVSADIERGDYHDPHTGHRTVREYAAVWLDASGADENSRENAEGQLRKHIYPTFGDSPVTEITPSAIVSWHVGLVRKGLAERTRLSVFNLLQSILDLAADDKKVRNPCREKTVQQRKPRKPATRVQAWPTTWVNAIHGALHQQWRILVLLGSMAGLRQGEILGLSQDDVDWFGCSINVRRQVKIVRHRLHFALPKRRRTRTVPISPELRDALSAHLAGHAAIPVTLPWSGPGHDGEETTVPLILTTGARTALDRNSFNSRIWKPALRAVGIPDTRENGCHALRHYYASVMLARGVSITDLAAYLGHADKAFTLRTYSHFLPELTDRARSIGSEAFRALFDTGEPGEQAA